ncbi:MAG TPA: gas vesicle protein GvpD P-loop domain-containing protein [Thermoplasmata archaeon]
MSEISSKAIDASPHHDDPAHQEEPDHSLPSELRTFVSRPGPQSILVRGPPGSGKTTLALGLLGAFSGSRILITNRVGQAELQRDFRWLHIGPAGSIQVVDAENRTRGLAQAVSASHALPKVLSQAGSDDVAGFLWLPEPVQAAYASIDPHRPGMVVIDSWDALVEDFMASGPSGQRGVPDREEVERLLLSYMRRSDVTLVLILERDVQSQLDYLVNAVVSTDRKTVDGRLERWLYLHKLRGQRIETPGYPFSLEGSRFESVAPFHYGSVVTGGPRPSSWGGEPRPKDLAGRVWPGCTDFALAFGVFQAGTTTVVETDSEVPYPIIQMLVEPAAVQTLSAGGHVLLIPPPGIRPLDLWQLFRTKFAAEKLAAQLRIFSVAGAEGVPQEAQPVMLPLPPGSGSRTDPIFHTAFEFVREGGPADVPNVIVRTTGGERALAQMLGLPVSPENFATVAAAYVANLRSHQIVVGNSGDPLLMALNDLGSLHLQLRARQGRYFLNGIRPFTPSYVVIEGNRLCPYRLLRMV